ncbi:glycosyltransferase family 39 protein [Candidatus Pelagibacter communis]|uniref:glycosyltransferase family 39 protein n=1 Tax=Pelagibacter ubique TaxID=198252 RepID=UPI00094D7859|nr:glycosyltransferase family 39 protein [Candidatus Pelagibacter ubique]
MDGFKRNINNIFLIFIFSHLIIWTSVPSLTNNNLPLDLIEALAWGSNLDWGFNKHPPGSAFFTEMFYRIFGPQDWAYYLLSQIFVIIAFFYVFKLSNEIFKNSLLSLMSVLLLESIYFYNFTTPEFNVNVCQLPFWAMVVYYSWKIYNKNHISVLDCIFLGLFGAIGFLSKYLFLYLLLSVFFLFIYLIFKKIKKFDFKYLIIFEIFIVILIPHLIWLNNNDYVTISYGLKRTGLEQSTFIDHIKYPLLFIIKQIGLLIPFFVLVFLLVKKIRFKFNIKDKKLIFLTFVNFMPIILMLITSVITGSRIRTMWMTPFYLFFGLFAVYVFQSKINLKKIKNFLYGFIFLFFLSPALYAYISIKETNKRTDYFGKEISELVERRWNKNFSNEIMYVVGDEWYAGNLSYHLPSRPKWFLDLKDNINKLNPKGGIIYVGNSEILKEICLGDFGKIDRLGYCMIGSKY